MKQKQNRFFDDDDKKQWTDTHDNIDEINKKIKVTKNFNDQNDHESSEIFDIFKFMNFRFDFLNETKTRVAMNNIKKHNNNNFFLHDFDSKKIANDNDEMKNFFSIDNINFYSFESKMIIVIDDNHDLKLKKMIVIDDEFFLNEFTMQKIANNINEMKKFRNQIKDFQTQCEIKNMIIVNLQKTKQKWIKQKNVIIQTFEAKSNFLQVKKNLKRLKNDKANQDQIQNKKMNIEQFVNKLLFQIAKIENE